MPNQDVPLETLAAVGVLYWKIDPAGCEADPLHGELGRVRTERSDTHAQTHWHRGDRSDRANANRVRENKMQTCICFRLMRQAEWQRGVGAFESSRCRPRVVAAPAART